MPLPKKYHAATFMGLLVMLLLLGLYLLSSGGLSQQAADTNAAAESSSRTAALARNQQLSPSSSSSSAQQHHQYRHPIMYDKLTGATNNQINDVLGSPAKQPHLQAATSDYPIDHYQHYQQQQPQHPNLLADPQQQQRHRQQMLDRQMLFGPPGNNPFGPPPHLGMPMPPPPPPPIEFANNQSATTTQPSSYYPDPLYSPPPPPPASNRQPPFHLPPSPQPPPPSSSQSQQQQQTQPSANQIRPPYAHLAPSMNMPSSPMSQYDQQQQQQQQQLPLKPAAVQQSRIIPLNSRIDPQTTTPTSVQPPPSLANQQQLQPSTYQQQPQMVSASNQAPPKTLNSILNNPQPQANSRLATAVPVCVRQQIDQQQQVPPPSSTDATNNATVSRIQMPILFCNIDPEYPTKEIMRALEIYGQEQRTIEHLLPQLLIQLHIQAPTSRQPGGNHQLLTLDQLQPSLLSAAPWLSSNSSSSSSQSTVEKPFPSANFEQMCRSTIQMAQPKRAKNLAGQWKIVVNLPGHKYRGIAISQMVRVEECSAPLSECATPSKPSAGLAKSSCLQHFENQRLVAWSPQQGLHTDMFRMPVACSCHIRRS